MSYEVFKKDFDELATKLDGFLNAGLRNFVEIADAYDKCQDALDTWLSSRNDLHEQMPDFVTHETSLIWFSQDICVLVGNVAFRFSSAGGIVPAKALLISCWNSFTTKQFESGHRIYRASIALILAQLTYIQGDIAAATWWALHTQADDHLGQSVQGGAGRQFMKTVLGVSKSVLDALSEIGKQNFATLSADKFGWKSPPSFAEDVVVRFALEKRALSYILGNNSTTLEYPLVLAYFQSLLNEIDVSKLQRKKASATNLEKGNALEKLAAYLLLLIPGWLPLRNVQDEKQTTEIDLVVRNVYPNGNLMADIFGRYFIVECKNWVDPVGSRDVGYFLNKIRQSHANFGIIFSRKGITGNRTDERAAKELTRRAFHEDKTVCIVISRNDLEKLKAGETTFRSLLLELFEEFRFGRPKNLG